MKHLLEIQKLYTVAFIMKKIATKIYFALKANKDFTDISKAEIYLTGSVEN